MSQITLQAEAYETEKCHQRASWWTFLKPFKKIDVDNTLGPALMETVVENRAGVSDEEKRMDFTQCDGAAQQVCCDVGRPGKGWKVPYKLSN